MAKIIYPKSIYISILYILYVLNFSVVTIFYPNLNLQFLRNAYLILLAFFFLRISTLKLNILVFSLLIVCLLSILFNTIHPVFNAPLRLVFLTLVLLPLGLILKPKYSSEEIIDLKFIFKVNRSIVVLSFFLYILFGFGSFFQKGNFSGVLNHANTMGPIAVLVFLERFIYFFKKKKSLKIIGVCVIAFFVIILTGSRAALFTLILSLSFVGFYIFRLKFIIWGFGAGVLLLSVFFTLKQFNSALIPEAHQNNKYRPRTVFEKGFDNTRFVIWEERIDEFIENPLLGSGFSAVNTDVVPSESPSYDIETGSIQPGSSYLGVLSMTGLFGLLVLLFIIYYSISLLFKKRKFFGESNFLMIISALVFILLHSIFEGYILSSGNLLFFIFWITIAYIFNKHEIAN